MARQENVFPECNVDTNLVGYIIGGKVKHKECCNEVVKVLNKSDEFAIGIIDDDKKQPTLDSGFVEHKFISPYKKQHISFYLHTDRKRYLFKIHKAMDEFILDAAKEMKVNMSEFGYSDDLSVFRRVTKTQDASVNSQLRHLFDEIKDHQELVAFRNTLKYLINQKYNTDPEIAKKFFDGRMKSKDLTQFLVI